MKIALVAALFVPVAAFAQTGNRPASTGPTYDPRVTFAPLTLPDPVNSYRSSNGAPGPQYWQNEADYVMHAAIDTEKHVLSNDEVITYTNNSPDALPTLWIHLEQNLYRKNSRGTTLGTGAVPRQRRGQAAAAPAGPPPENHTEGIEFDSFEVEAATPGAKPVKADYLVDDTRMEVRLPEPLKAHGKLKLHLKYHYTITGPWGGRTSVGSAEHGEIYDIAQWYPRMCVYDDIRGWDTLPYIGSEFYLEYGDFDYSVTVPSSFIVAGGGELVNPADVLTKREISRLEEARHSDKTVLIRTPEETSDPASRPGREARLRGISR